MSRQRVLITGARSAVAVDLAREFYRAGYEVHVADCSSAFIARWSNAVHKFHYYASPVAESGRFTRDIEELVDQLNPQLVIPTCEEVFHLSKPTLRASLKHLLFAPPHEQLRTLHNKDSFMGLCKEAQITVPYSHTLTSREMLVPYLSNPEKWVFKPCYSRFGALALIGPATKELERITPTPQNPWLAQKRIHGQEFSFYAVAKEGALIAFSPYHSEWRIKGGASYAFTPAPVDVETEIRDIAARIAEKLELTGQFSCDLIMDDKGQLWPIECNPRATSGLHLLCREGALARAIMKTLPVNATNQTRFMLPMMCLHGLRIGRLPSWYLIMSTGTDVLGASGDRLPLLGALLDTCVFGIKAVRKGISLAQATTVDIEWNGEPLA